MSLTPLIHQHRAEIALEAARKGKAQLDTAKDELCRNEGAMATLSSALEVVCAKRTQLLNEPPEIPPTVNEALADVEKMLAGLVEAAATNIIHSRGRVRGAQDFIDTAKELHATEQTALQTLHSQLFTDAKAPEPPVAAPAVDDQPIPQASRKRLEQQAQSAQDGILTKRAPRRPRKVTRK